MFVSIKVTLIKNNVNRIIRTLIAITILLKCNTIISMRLRDNTQLLQNCNFMFLLYQQTFNYFDLEDEILSYIIDVNFSIMQINNTLDQFIKIDKNPRLDSLQKYEEESYYIIVLKYFYLVINFDIFTKL